MIRVQHSKYNPKVAKANKISQTHDVGRPRHAQGARRPVKPANDYTVQVKGLDATSGTYLLGFYLPGRRRRHRHRHQGRYQDDQVGSRHDGREARITASTPTSTATASSTART